MANLRAACPILPAPWGVGTAEGWIGDSGLPCSPLPRKNSRLQFNKVKLEDAGEYVCEAENILGKDSVRGQLHVNSGRYLTPPLTSLEGSAGWGQVSSQWLPDLGGPHITQPALDPLLPALWIQAEIWTDVERCRRSINV